MGNNIHLCSGWNVRRLSTSSEEAKPCPLYVENETIDIKS